MNLRSANLNEEEQSRYRERFRRSALSKWLEITLKKYEEVDTPILNTHIVRRTGINERSSEAEPTR